MVKVRQKKAKIKHSKKPVRKKHLKKRPNILLPLLILIGFLILVYVGSRVFIKSQNKMLKLSAAIPLRKNVIKTSNLITPYPSITVTPTPVPLTGFCLRIPILTYHHIQPEQVARDLKQTSLTVDNGVFDQQMAYILASGYTPIWANELVSALLAHSQLPGKPVMITMDDGYADNFTYALPVLRKYNIKANLMLASGLVESNSDMLTWNQVKEMKNSGLFYFTNHTWSHYSIANGPQSKIESEIDIAQTEIQQNTGQTVNIFTYPYGSFNLNAIQTLSRKGYQGAFSTIPGQYQCDSFIMTLHRTRIGNSSLAAYGI